MVPVPARNNALQGDFGEAWLEAVAAGCGLLHGRPSSVDLEKADVELTFLGTVAGTYNPTVKVQVKTEVNLRRNPDGTFVYNLDIATYDVLRREDHSVRRILAVFGLSGDGSRVRLHADGTMLVGHGSWVSLEGYPPSDNTTSQVVRLPVSNTLDGPGLDQMLKTYGVRRSTLVPEVDPWDITDIEGEQ
jgi:hypothetical protein